MRFLVALAITTLLSAAHAQSTQPATAPTTRPRYVAKVPEGFVRMEIEGREFLLEPADETWVRAALAAATPTTAPSTMPSDLLERLRSGRDALRDRMMRDLGLADGKQIDEYFDQRLTEFLRTMDEYRPPIIYLVSHDQRLKQILQAGWTDPHYYYNRAADYVAFDARIALGPGVQDDTLMPMLYDPKTDAIARQQLLLQTMRANETNILTKVSREAIEQITVGFVDLISATAFKDIKFAPDQEWLGVGISGVMAAKYICQLSGMDEKTALDGMSLENWRNPIRPGTIDLLRPMNLTDFRNEALGAYLDAYRRRSMQVVRVLVERGGDGAIARLLEAMRKSMPPDGPGLVKLIQQTTGVDLTKELAVQK